MTINTKTRDARVEEYVQRCEPLFADLPADVQRSLADDVREIVAEVAAQLDGDPADLVGPPQTFCKELRTSAGYPPTAPTVDPKSSDMRSSLFTMLRTAIRETAWPATRDFLKELRPAWWVLRGLGFALLFDSDHLVSDYSLIPELQGSGVLWVLFAMGSVVASIALGRGTLIAGHHRRKLAVALMSVLAIGTLLNEVSNVAYLGQTTTNLTQVAVTEPGNAFAVAELAIEDTAPVPSVYLQIVSVEGQEIYNGRQDPQSTLQTLLLIAETQPPDQKYIVSLPNDGIAPTVVESFDNIIGLVEARYFGGAAPIG